MEGVLTTRCRDVAAKIGAHLAALQASGNFYTRQALRLTNQELVAYYEGLRAQVVRDAVKGALADAFMEKLERDIGPTHGRPIPERWQRFLAEAVKP